MPNRTCQNCGKEYNPYLYNEAGRQIGVRTRYCSSHCCDDAKSKRAVTVRRKDYAAVETYTKSRGNGNGHDEQNRGIGPAASKQCFYCPLLGWTCRTEKRPPCSTLSARHEEYKQAISQVEVMG